MNEVEQAELFNRELDAILQGGGTPSASGDGALRLAASLAAVDFSGESRVKASLRARLIPAGEGFASLLRGLLANNYARAAFAAAAIAVALLPSARRQPAPAPQPAVVAQIPAPAPLGATVPPPSALTSRLPASLRESGSAGPLFASLPMAELRGEPIKAPVMELSSGNKTERQGGTAIIFETGSGTFALERREVEPEQIFELRTL
ncbi:MAG: hypothetical protein CVU79_11565 [Elusimicrobia bacterium HGW-Elusimicrobia-3]|nr:MAG: hypothetical protein CVU79_11565 [Elusimicrobia bacterium HGW-Elusimicrobia-3]